MKISISVANTKLPIYAVFHLAIMLLIGLLVFALANWRAVNETLISIITIGGNFWPAAILSAGSATFPLARALADGEEDNYSPRIAFISLCVCLIAARGAWLVHPGFSGNALESWAMGTVLVLALLSAMCAVLTLVFLRSEI
ncbi:hypothetical protein [Xanthomonas vesicatoria]|uniref:hypothetical protein n=1 Tax=Xanthomonas vesicatoria TaxID=56460 RepID=UPI001E418A7E|nr:hypothetical protein [Xanthomonas vesicatoria]MCC8630195.1 hypothetical protein [Xanthomonas vesicatoria]